MPYLIGFVLALTVGGYATAMRLDRDRAFHPTMLITVASYYVLFAILGGSGRTIVIESLTIGAFVFAATVGFRRRLWLVCAALAAHGLLDAVHGRFVDNPGVPSWWPAWCLAYDVAAAGYLAWQIPRAGATPAGCAVTIPSESA